jgi:hypothetical protein
MKSELVGETVVLMAPATAIVALACEAAVSVAVGAELEAVDVDALTTALQDAADELEASTQIEARVVLVEDGVDVTFVPAGGDPAATIEYRV